MRSVRSLVLISFVLFSGINASAQQTPQRDPQALAVLSKMLTVSGWTAAGLPADAVATGIVSRYHGDTQDAVGVTLKFKGPSEARVEVTDASSPTTTIINGEQATVSKSAGTHAIPAHSALSTPPVAMPFFCNFLNTSDLNLAFHFLGTESVSGQVANRVEIYYTPTSDDPHAQIHRRAGHITLWISTASFLPIQVQYPRISNDNPTAVFLATRLYSDYRTINGIAVPFHQDEYFGNQLAHSLQLSTVNFNTGLSNADFAILVTAQ